MKTKIFSARRRAFAVTALTAALIGVSSFLNNAPSSAQKFADSDAPEAATITGRVYQDYNSNGAYDTAAGLNSIDSGVAGVTVAAYDPAGVQRGSTTTVAGGTFSLAATGTGPYRVEFTGLPAGMTVSARSTDSVLGGSASDSGSTVQFVNNVNTSNVNLALVRQEEYCQNTPTLVTARYAQGASDGVFSGNAVLFDFPYNAGTTYNDTTIANYDNPTTHSLSVTVGSLGTINSLAYNRVTNRIYAASYFKRHAGFGPGADQILDNSDDPGAIYVVNPTSNTITARFTVPGATTNSHDVNDYDADNGNTGWNGSGKRSLGGMALADDNSRLFVMNLENRQLYALDPTTGANLGNSATPDGLTMNTPGGTGATCPTGGDRRPFAVRYYRGNVYIGVVCTAQSTANANDLFAYVFQVNPTTLAINATPVYQQALNYTRGFADPGWAAEWRPWVSTVPADFAYPQPMLTDIDFDNDNLILSIRDRSGDADWDVNKRTAGETIRACGSFGAWTTESNGRCGGTGTSPQNTGQGPSNGEFYHNDDFCLTPNGANYHDEIGWGAVLQLPGRTHSIATLLDPISRTISDQTFDGGFRYFNNTTGAADRAYRLYNGTGGSNRPDFGKANGLGDMVALCNPAPIEIGNRVWRDANANGVQDPGENPIANVTVRLFEGSNLRGTAVTDANGEYYFVAGTDGNTGDNIGQVSTGILYSTAYQVRFDNAANYNAGGPLNGLLLTVLNQTSQSGDDDSSDSDASSVTNPSGSPAGTWPVIALTTGGPGANDHRFDAGFAAAPTAAEVSLSGRVMLQAGNGIRNVRVTLVEEDGTVHNALTGSFGYYRFDGIPAGQAVVVRVAAKRFSFTQPSRLIVLTDDLSDMDFVAEQ